MQVSQRFGHFTIEVLDKGTQGYHVRSDIRRKTQLHKIGGSSGITVLKKLQPRKKRKLTLSEPYMSSEKVPLSLSDSPKKAMEGRPYRSFGTCWLQIFIENRTVTQEVHILQSLPQDVLLGNNFMQLNFPPLRYGKMHPLWPNELKDAPKDNSDSDSWEDHDELEDKLEVDSDSNSWDDQDELKNA